MIWFLMIATGIFTFGTRFILLSGIVGKKLPAWLIEALGFVPIAVLTAIIVPAVLIDPASQHIAVTDNPRLLAAFIAIAVALIPARSSRPSVPDWQHCGHCNGFSSPVIICTIGFKVSGHYQPPFYRRLRPALSQVQ